ncbi:MAG: DUF4190 domain-containing protein [Actinobacteria bacterium]|nr:DUF4190 domain-containing protein [Actinomycetota bacterium]
MASPDPPPPPAPSAAAGTNGFAIAALILGAIGAVVLAPIFGIIALIQIRKRGQPGKGLAIAGLVLAGSWTLLIVAVAVVVLLTDAKRGPSGDVAEAGSLGRPRRRALFRAPD